MYKKKIKKILNFYLINFQEKIRLPYVFGYPYHINIDPTNICNLQCPFCMTGSGKNLRKKGHMSFTIFKKIIDELGPYLIHIDFFIWGEPLLNKKFCDMVKYAKKYGIITNTNTNFTILNEKLAEDIVNSGLDYINLSIDGASQKTYEVYRKGGNFNKIMNNVELLNKKKKELGKNNPHIIWSFLVFRHNEHEIEKARKIARKLEIEFNLREANIYPGFDKFIPKKKYEYKDKSNKINNCERLWKHTAFHYDGSVAPCNCVCCNKEDDFGNIVGNDFKKVWNNKNYLTARLHMMIPSFLRLLRHKNRINSNKIVCVSRCFEYAPLPG